MRDESLSFLQRLLETPSPSGFERPVQDVVREWVRPFADEVRTDRHGNVIAVRHPAQDRRDGADLVGEVAGPGPHHVLDRSFKAGGTGGFEEFLEEGVRLLVHQRLLGEAG